MLDKLLFKLPHMGRALALLVAGCLVQAGLVIAQALLLADVLAALWAGAGVQAVLGGLAAFAGCFAGQHLAEFAQDELVDRFACARVAELRTALLASAFAGGGTARDLGAAPLVASALEGADQLETYLRLVPPKTAGLVAITLPVLVCVFALDWVSGVILALLFPVVIFYMVMLGRLAAQRARAQFGTYQALAGDFIDTLRGLDVICGFGAEEAEERRVFRTSEQFRRATVDTLKVATLSGAVLDVIATLGVAAVAIMLAFRLMDGSMALSTALACLVLSPEFFKPVRAFAGDFHASLDGRNALHAVMDVLERDRLMPQPEPCAIAPWGPRSRLQVEGLAFSYGEGDDARTVLHDVSFAVAGCARVGIVGASGAGKSTLVRMLGGFAAPSAGSIVVDGARIGSLQQRDWREQLLFIPQAPYLFHDTLRANIAFYAPDADDAAVAAAVEAAGLAPLVAELPEGLGTVIGEAGRTLSGGQAQRVALARALVDSTRRVLLFDEPTAHLDTATELELKQRMLQAMEGRLVFFATHRMHWLRDMDLVLVVRDGTVAACGTYEELQACGALDALAGAEGGAA